MSLEFTTEGVMNEIEGGVTDPLSKYESRRITREKVILRPDPLVTIGGCHVAAAGNITGISAASKAGKTAISGVFRAGAISRTGVYDGFSSISIEPNRDCKAVINFDTEQDDADQQRNLNAVLKRCGIESTPEYYLEYNIRDLSPNECKTVTDEICEAAAEKFGGIHLITVDGGADYLESVLDDKSSSEIVKTFTQLAIKYNCPVIILLHLNPGSDKERGHFGSEIQRKCLALLTIERKGEVSTLTPKLLRRGGAADVGVIDFQYCRDAGYHKELEQGYSHSLKKAADYEKCKGLADRVFASGLTFKYNDLKKKIMDTDEVSEKTAKNRIDFMKGNGIIKKVDDLYMRVI